MAKIDAETLRQWLAEGKAVTVLDVRSAEDRALWSIPGSVHVDAYSALQDGRSHALDQVAIPSDRPIVTVCNRGKVSQIAADVLATKGANVLSLDGGMQAWSLAWNIADVPISLPGPQVIQVRRTGKGCLSYILGSGDSAAIIDASVDPRVYTQLAEHRGWRIRHVLDTHIHADHISRSRALAQITGATLRLPAGQRVHFDFAAVSDGDAIEIGSARLAAIRTPGHTAESTCYWLNDACLFTGDTLFLAAFGRPDLHADKREARERARLLFASLSRLRTWPSDLLVLPGHTSEPVAFDGVPLTSGLGQVFSRLGDWLVSEDVFTDRVLARLPATPPNYQRIVEINEHGTGAGVDAAELEAGANRCAVG
ncbi:MAG TPA: MBL fold metallo-hydrolase [Candidatus Solibacter sp.]|nr:MBL fold metallo-hydrolase [Candidatus Solibacter sp.]